MRETEMMSETLGFCPQLTRLVAREDFIEDQLDDNTYFRIKKIQSNAITAICSSDLPA
jgi:hypothetical protein